MRSVVAALIVLCSLSACSQQPSAGVQIALSSDPFPLTVGQTTLLVSVTDVDGTPVDGATVEVSGNMKMPGMLPQTGSTNIAVNGEYQVPIIWPMVGEWTIDVTATLPDRQVQERFDVFIYGVPAYNGGSRTTYRSVREVSADVSSNAEHEFWIVIPLGTQALIRSGMGDDVIPADIRLNLSGQHVLVIRNDDIADHTVGPFFVRAGETIRQNFTQTAVFQGTCTIRHNADINIVVEA
jgi:hypothetical protein